MVTVERVFPVIIKIASLRGTVPFLFASMFQVICKSHPPSASVTPVTQKKKVLNHGFVFITLSHLNPIPFQLSFSLSLSPTSKKLKILYNQPTTIFLVKRGSIFKATKGEREAWKRWGLSFTLQEKLAGWQQKKL